MAEPYYDRAGGPSTNSGGLRYHAQQTRQRPLYLSQLQLQTPQPSGTEKAHYFRPQNPVRDDYDEKSYIGDHESFDNFDRALLAEPAQDRQWQAAHGLTRLSLPPRSLTVSSYEASYATPSLATPDERPTSDTPRTRVHHQDLPEDSQDFLYRPTLLSHLPSSPTSLCIFSSPSYEVSRRRGSHISRKSHSIIEEEPFTLRRPSLETQHASAGNRTRIFHNAPPTIQGIQLVSPNELPDRFRSVFPFQVFNAVQSKCFETVYRSSDNLVLSAPTGSGKTVVLEMAICRLVSGFQNGHYKIIYMAPTKSLCSERQGDWQRKFKHLDLQCAELTGDTDHWQLRNVQNASIIITTPEKWDSMTRKWKDHIKLMQLVKLFLVDEVHILKESRGATLEAVISRMKSVGSNVRFVALSATVPNSEDVATWLGKDHTQQHLPAHREIFGEEFRPVRLQKYVYGLKFRGNDFAFDSICDSKLPDVIAKHSDKKPIMVFCCTRKSTLVTAKLLAALWATKSSRDRDWSEPDKVPLVSDLDLKATLASGVAFHHGGLDAFDRQAVEKGFLEGDVNVICCTSTLAVGVNLPCHLVIIKNTVSWQDEGLKEYADLEMMQMLGRAGRPQFGNTATAVIITKQEKVEKYERLVSGSEILESCLHLNLVDHLNAEIGLGTVRDLYTAKRWLAGTFLYVRLGQNPAHYKLDGDAASRSLDERIEQICERDIGLLNDTKLILSDHGIKSTEFGIAMARYYVKFDTMTKLLSLPPRAKMSEILSALVQAEEFHEVRFRSGEKGLYKTLNSASGIKFPIQIDIAQSAQKRSIILQAELGEVEYPADELAAKHKRQYQQDRAILFSHIHRLIRCVIDCKIHLQDGPAIRHALELARSLGARVWDNSPLQMKQIPSIGPVAVRKLVTAGINSLETLEGTEASRMNLLLSKQPGFGEKILGILRTFPKLRVFVKSMGNDLKPGRTPIVRIKAEVGFINERIPDSFNKKIIYVCFIAERSDGLLIDFRRMSAKKLGNGEDILLSTELSDPSQYVTCYVMCDEIAGTLQYAELKLDLPASSFPAAKRMLPPTSAPEKARLDVNMARKGSSNDNPMGNRHEESDNDNFYGDGIEDSEMLAAVDELEFKDIDTLEPTMTAPVLKNPALQKTTDAIGYDWKPQRLENGKWACNHKCRDKTACKHLCCRDGIDRAPKAPKLLPAMRDAVKCSSAPKSIGPPLTNKSYVKTANGSFELSEVEVVDLSSEANVRRGSDTGLGSLQSLKRLHSSIVKNSPILLTTSSKFSEHTQLLSRNGDTGTGSLNRASSDDEPDWVGDLLSPSVRLMKKQDGEDADDGESSDQEALLQGSYPPKMSREHHRLDDTYASPFQLPSVDLSARSNAEGMLLRDGQDQFCCSSNTPTSPDIGISDVYQVLCNKRLLSPLYSPGGVADSMKGLKQTEMLQSHSNSAPNKKQRVDIGEGVKVADIPTGLPVKLSEQMVFNELKPWDDMTGIDMDFLAEIANIVEFV